MTSRNLFFKMVRQDIRRRMWCPVLIAIAYFLCLEVRLLMEIDRYGKEAGRYFYDRGFYDISVFVREHFFGRDAVMMSIVTCAAAFLCGISGYAYLHSRTQLDTYHSLPVSRKQVFWSRYVSGILQFFLPFVIHMLICAGIAAGRDAFFIETVPALASYIVLHLLIFAVSYAVTVSAVVLTGNIIVSILGAAVLLAYSTVVDVLANLLSDRFFDTYIVYGDRTYARISEKIWCFSPLSMLLKLFSRPNSLTMEDAKEFYKYDASYMWVLAAAAVAYSLAAYFLYLKRATEAAGRPIAFGAAEPVIKTMIVIPVSFLAAVFLGMISPESASGSWFLFGLAFSFVVLCILMEIIFRLDIRGIFMHKKQFLFNAACTALIYIVFRYDVLGYDLYVPADQQLQSCAVSIHDLMPLPQRADVSEFGSHYLGEGEYRMAHMEMQGNPSVMELARKAAKEQLTYRYFDHYEGIETVPEYIESMNKQKYYEPVSFGYKLQNGKTVYRKYIIDVADPETIRLLADIFEDPEYKLGSTPLFDADWDIAFDCVRCENNFKAAKIDLTPEMQAELVETYRKEYMELTLDTVMHKIPVGTIDFRTERDHVSSSYSDEMIVYPQFTGTIALLREYGFDMEEKLTAEDVGSVILRTHASHASEGENDAVEYTDKEQIQQILDSIVSDGLVNPVIRFTDLYDERYDIDVQYNAENGIKYYYRFLRSKLPDFVPAF